MSLGEGYGKDDYGMLKGAPPPLALVSHPHPIACLAELSKLWGRAKGRNVCEAPLANLRRNGNNTRAVAYTTWTLWCQSSSFLLSSHRTELRCWPEKLTPRAGTKSGNPRIKSHPRARDLLQRLLDPLHRTPAPTITHRMSSRQRNSKAVAK